MHSVWFFYLAELIVEFTKNCRRAKRPYALLIIRTAMCMCDLLEKSVVGLIVRLRATDFVSMY